MNEFEKLGIIKEILKSIEEHHFKVPTTVQEESIPLIIGGRDVVGKSATGSGKTLAFGCGIIQNLVKGQGLGAVILTPTRELAEQVSEALISFSKYKPLNIIAIYGGVSITPQINRLRTADIIVATPGRLLDHMQRDTIDLTKVKTLVLDEADRMLDMGFINDVKKIISRAPKNRQTLLFSATMSSDIKDIERNYMNNPARVSAKSHVDPSKLKQVYYDAHDKNKFSLLVHMLKSDHTGLVMVFCNTRMNVDFVSKNLKHNGVNAIAIHGGFTQSKRSETLKRFQSKNVSALVCTDVAARGLDIPNVSHVYNYDLPADSKEYIHRIGRTARAGRDGMVINLVSPRDHDNFSKIISSYREINIEKQALPQQIERANIKQVDRNPRPKSRFGQNNRPKRRFNHA